jgi:hypothetical protein
MVNLTLFIAKKRFHGMAAALAMAAACGCSPAPTGPANSADDDSTSADDDSPPPPKRDAAPKAMTSPVDAGAGAGARTDSAPPADAPARGDAAADAGGPSAMSLVANPLGPLPKSLKDVGVYTALPDRKVTSPRAHSFRPVWELWSNGLGKERLLVLPEGKKIDTKDRNAWDFPVGTLFFKTFTFNDPAMGGKERPVETRLIRRTQTEWEFAVWVWNDAGTDAELADIMRSIPKEVTVDGEKFNHRVPSKADCGTCHLSNVVPIIGFDELRLNGKLEGRAKTQLQEAADAGMFTMPVPATPDEITAADATTKAVMGYVHGNCGHCHNDIPNDEKLGMTRSFDLRHKAFLKNTVNVMTMTSGTASGLRILPGDPSKSILYLAVWGESGNVEVKLMPPVGVQRRDRMAIELLRTWITNLKK